jgi:hypothetical protein
MKWSHCSVILLIECGFNEMVVEVQVRHKSVNTPLSLDPRWRPWHTCHAFRAALLPTNIYCKPGAYDKLFVG